MSLSVTFSYLLHYFLIIPACGAVGPIVETSLGKIRGYYNYSQHGRQYEAFVVPFAQAPIGNLRFEPPVEVQAWQGTFVATDTAPNCMAYNTMEGPSKALSGSEDCLYLKIYTPEHRPKKLQPVIVWFHLGALHFKVPPYSGPNYLMDRDVVFVDVNFRLGPLGFLSTEDHVVPGNMGLKDQTMALKWLSRHVQSFGGDPKRITIVGGSGGGISANYHYLSSLSRGLFHAAMSLGGSATSIYLQRSESLKNAKSLASMVDCPNDNVAKMVGCLKSRSAENLTLALSQFPTWNGYLFYSPFGVVVEKPGKNAFLDRAPIDILKAGDVYDVPWLTSTVTGEGIFPVAAFFLNESIMKTLNDNWETMGLSLVRMDEMVEKSQASKVAQIIRQEYFGCEDVSVKTKNNLMKYAGDRVIKSFSEKTANMMAKKIRSPVWFYNYDYRSNGSYSSVLTRNNDNFGSVHSDDMLLVLQTPGVQDSVETADDLAMQENLLDLWVSMASNGEPQIGGMKWSPVDPSDDNLQYLFIRGPNDFELKEESNFGNRLFWNSLSLKDSII